jgi:transposase
MTTAHLGIDIAKATLDCALLLPTGKFRSTSGVANTPAGGARLVQWLAGHHTGPVHVCLEATGSYWETVAEALVDAGHTVSVINPTQIRAFAKACLTRGKTDRGDARLLARFCAERQPAPWQAPPAIERTLKALLLRLEALQTMRVQEQNRADVARDVVQAGIRAHLAWLDTEIAAVLRAIRQHIDADPTLRDRRRLLDSIPGVGEHTIALVLAFALHPDRFRTARQAAAFVGLDPRPYESGSSVRGKPRLSKIGHAVVRKRLYMPAITALYHTAWGKHFYQRLAAAGKAPMLIIGAMMRKLVHVAFGVLKSGQPFNPALHGG